MKSDMHWIHQEHTTQSRADSKFITRKVLELHALKISGVSSREDWDLPQDNSQNVFIHGSRVPSADHLSSPCTQARPWVITTFQSDQQQECVHERRLILWAAANGDVKLMKFLLSKTKSDLSFRNYYGQTALSLAAEHGYVSMVRLLLSRIDIDINIPDIDGQSSLAWAAFHGHVDVLDLLSARDDLVADTRDIDGNTALAWAAANGHYAAASLLLKRFDVEINPVNFKGQRPRDLARLNGHHNMIGLFAMWTGDGCHYNF